jgi:hypothetical protein
MSIAKLKYTFKEVYMSTIFEHLLKQAADPGGIFTGEYGSFDKSSYPSGGL